VSYSASGFESLFALVSATGLGLTDDLRYFSYQTVAGDSSFGSLNFTNVSSVPLPGGVWLFGCINGQPRPQNINFYIQVVRVSDSPSFKRG
jgi:hypothetical protein